MHFRGSRLGGSREPDAGEAEAHKEQDHGDCSFFSESCLHFQYWNSCHNISSAKRITHQLWLLSSRVGGLTNAILPRLSQAIFFHA